MFSLFILGVYSCMACADADIQNIRMAATSQKTRLVFDSSSPVHYRLMPLSSRKEWKLELLKSHFLVNISQLVFSKSPIERIQLTTPSTKSPHRNTVHFVLKQPMRIKSFTLAPQASYGHRLVLDFYPVKTDPRAQIKSFVIAIDAGHGGVDPGAVGKGGTLEKNIVLAIARQLKVVLRKEAGLAPILIRKGDYFLTLKQRIARARKARADLFVSIHADSGRHSDATGSSVYVLSERGASSEAARWLAHRENQSDLMGGGGSVSLKNRDKLLASVLLDLSMTAKVDASSDAARMVLESLSTVDPLHKPEVEYAGFVVLKSPDMPSILVETAFISNHQDEKKLNNKRYQRILAEAIAMGLKHYAMKQRQGWQEPVLAQNDPHNPEKIAEVN